MAIREFPVTRDRAEALVERTPEQLQAYLVGRGLTVDGVSVSLDPPVVRIESDADPTPHLTSAPWPQKRNRQQARAAMKAFMDKVNAGQTPTNAEVIAALRGIIVELARD